MRYNQPVEVSHSCSNNNNNFVEKLIEVRGNQSAFFTPQHLIESRGNSSANLNAFADNLLAGAATLLCNQREINDNVRVISVETSQNTHHPLQVKSLGEGEINYLRLGLHKVDPLDEEDDSEENCSSRFSCSTESSLADSLMDDGGNDFSSTPSMSSPEPNYTRGIINPNYPGFQHLAHTLSEHFANYNFEHLSDDSEISEECDNDLSLGGGGVDFANNFNNNNHFAPANSNIVSENGNDVEKNINLLQTSECKIFCEEKNLALVVCEEKISNAHVDAKWLKGEDAKGKQRDLPTPDILLKGDDTPDADNFCMSDTPSDTSPHANFQPDLLRNIDGSREIKRQQQQQQNEEIAEKIEIDSQSLQQGEYIVAMDGPKAPPTRVHEDEDEVRKMTTALWGASPVDIVGDFGEEVEREIVLIVSGYRKGTARSDSNFNNSPQDTKPIAKNQPSSSNISTLIHNKIADAELSTAEEKITMRSSLVELDRGSEQPRTRSLLPTAIVKPKQSEQCEPPASVEFCRPWNATQNVSSVSTVRKLPAHDRKIRQVAQKMSDTSVAVVTPRKKETTEVTTERKLPTKNVIGKCGRKMDETHVKKENKDLSASFDIYNIETALPKIDLEAIENHLRVAKEEERRKRNDREEIRRRLAMDAEDDYLTRPLHSERPTRKPSLHSRLQSGMNLQICFMNETASDNESLSSDSETCPKLSAHTHGSHSKVVAVKKKTPPKIVRPKISRPLSLPLPPSEEDDEKANFFTRQAQLQIEARMALAQAKDMAHMQMEIERQRLRQSPITDMIRKSLDKVGVYFPPEKRRLSRFFLTDLNIAQLQVIVNEMHNQIEVLNETLVKFLMERDELHMGQDSMLVDIEDLTRYFGAKESYNLDPRPQLKTLKTSQSVSH